MTKNSRIVLYQPKVDYWPYYPCYWAPLSLLSIAAPLVNKGYNVEIIDGNVNGSESLIQDTLSDPEGILFVGISTMIGGNQIERGISFGRSIKEVNASIPVIVGGPAGTIIPERLLECEAFDAIVRGQGEIPISIIADAITTGKDLSGIPGVVTRQCKNVPIPLLVDKNTFPPYPWEIIDVPSYLRNDPYTGDRTLNHVSSQGCPYRCGYCSEAFTCQSKWSAYLAERTFAEVADLVEKYNLTGIKFYDSNFFASTSRVKKFAMMIIESGLHVKWSASAHPKDIIRIADDMSMLKKSGLSRLLIGAESGYQPVLDYVEKGTTVEDNLTVARICAENEIPAAFTFIVGFPGIEGDINPTLKNVIEMKEISPEFDVKIHFYYPFPGSKLFDRAVEHGYQEPKSLLEFSGNDYYLIQTPWLDRHLEEKVRSFGDFYCDFLYPPQWFTDLLSQKPLSALSYKALRQIARLRVKFHYYHFPFEKGWFQYVTKHNSFERGDYHERYNDADAKGVCN